MQPTDRRPHPRRPRARFVLVAAALLSGCVREGVFAPAGPIAANNRMILLNALEIMLAIVIPTIIATLTFAWWFRAGNAKARFRPDFVYSGRIELIVWSIPVLTILFLSGVIWIGSHQLDPAQPIASRRKPVEVQVVSLDWKWLFIYPEQGIASVNRLVVPVGVPVHFALTSASVMNTFFVPRLGSSIYTMSGMTTQLNLRADQPGTFQGMSGHFSGDGFSDMDFPVEAVAPARFATWIAATRGRGGALDAHSYLLLARQSIRHPIGSYGAVQAGLFDAITAQRILPAHGPTTGRGGGTAISPGGQR